jgi:hypothetical protein
MKALSVDIYRSNYNPSRINPFNKFDGLNELMLISTKDVIIRGLEYTEAELKYKPTLIGIFRDVLCGKETFRAFPVDVHGEKLEGWWMFGGNYVTTSDSRFPIDYPVKLMERKEN